VVERQENSTFDALIRPSTMVAVQNTGGGTTRTYSSEFQYDTYYGRVLAQFFPNGEGEQFIFNQYGYETEQRNAVNASVYRQIVTVDSAGRPTRELKGFNLSTDTAYWPNGQTKSITHQKDGVTIRKINYAYDVFGNVATQELNNGMAGNTLESFSYDKLHRLTQSERTGAVSKTVTYGYDAAGNFNFKSDFSLNTGTPYNLSTGGLGGGGANAVKAVTLIGGTVRKYGYDASGNMTADDAGFTAKYDHANLATKLQRGSVINYFIYDANNAKARQTGTDGSKVYLGGYEDWITAGQTKVSLGNYAQVTNGTGGRVLNYFLTDRLGSVDAVTDGNGNLVETRGYDAFGAPRTGTWGDATQLASTAITPKGFTSHEHLNSVQLIHMNGRMYDYQLGRFLGVDPFIQAPTNSQSMNPYSYIMNNPLSGTDPTGYLAATIEDGGVSSACFIDPARCGGNSGSSNIQKLGYKKGDNGSESGKQDSKNKSPGILSSLKKAISSALVPNAADLEDRGKPGTLLDDARGLGTAVLNQGISLVNSSAHAPGLIGIAAYLIDADPNLIDKVYVPDKSLAGAVVGDIAFGTATALVPAKYAGGAGKLAPLEEASVNAVKPSALQAAEVRAPTKAGPALPDSAWHKDAPHQAEPGTGPVVHEKYNPRTNKLEKSKVEYDQYGRQVRRVDNTSHGYSDHTSPHLHTYEYGPGYGPKGKETRTNL